MRAVQRCHSYPLSVSVSPHPCARAASRQQHALPPCPAADAPVAYDAGPAQHPARHPAARPPAARRPRRRRRAAAAVVRLAASRRSEGRRLQDGLLRGSVRVAQGRPPGAHQGLRGQGAQRRAGLDHQPRGAGRQGDLHRARPLAFLSGGEGGGGFRFPPGRTPPPPASPPAARAAWCPAGAERARGHGRGEVASGLSRQPGGRRRSPSLTTAALSSPPAGSARSRGRSGRRGRGATRARGTRSKSPPPRLPSSLSDPGSRSPCPPGRTTPRTELAVGREGRRLPH